MQKNLNKFMDEKLSREDLIELDLPLKGVRDYIQGTSLYDGVSGALLRLGGLEDSWINYIVFRGFARSSCALTIDSTADTDTDIDNSLIRAQFTVRTHDKDIKGCVFETGVPIIYRVPFAEVLINQTAKIEDLYVYQTVRAGFSSIEEITILTKFLHNVQLPSEKGRWIFTRLDMVKPFSCDEDAAYGVKIKKNLANRMTVSDIEENGKVIGQIQFTVVLE